MSTKQSTIDFILDQSGEGVSGRKMFGEYALYLDGKVVALVCDDTLFVKKTDVGRDFLGTTYREGTPYPGAKPAMEIGDDIIEDRERLGELLCMTAEHLPALLPKRSSGKRKPNAR